MKSVEGRGGAGRQAVLWEIRRGGWASNLDSYNGRRNYTTDRWETSIPYIQHPNPKTLRPKP